MNQLQFPGILISVDGPDGCGKSSIASHLSACLKSHWPNRGAQVIKPSYFESSTAANRIGQELAACQGLVPGTLAHNKYFLRAMRENYLSVVLPALMAGQVVVLDSSEIRALAFVIDRDEPEVIMQTQSWLLSERLTAGIYPQLRLMLWADAADLQQNLRTKRALDSGDPNTLMEINRRIDSYATARSYIEAIGWGESVWVTYQIRHQPAGIDFVKLALDQIISNILLKLKT